MTEDERDEGVNEDQESDGDIENCPEVPEINVSTEVERDRLTRARGRRSVGSCQNGVPIERLGRAQFRVLDAEGNPIGGVPLTITITSESGETEIVRTTSGPTGYTTANLSDINIDTATDVSIEPLIGGDTVAVDPATIAENGIGAVRLGGAREYLQNLDLGNFDDQVFTLPPDTTDVTNAPELFNPSVIEKNGTCSLDFTAKVNVYENFFNQIVRMTPESEGEEEFVDDDRRLLTGQIPFPLTTDYPEGNDSEWPYLEHATEPSFGTLNVYKQSWTRVGHSLGKLLHSLTLAPCESTKVSIIEWSRTERGQRGERTTAREQKNHELYRERMIEEIVEGMVKEDQWGSSSSVQGGIGISGGIAGVIGGALGAVGLSIGGGAAYSSSESHGRRELQASTVQNLTDSVVQGASSMRSLRSNIVTQSQQIERDEVRTRAVENHNRNHAMTVEYFQVLEHYNVHTELIEETDVLMVPYDVPLELWDEMPAFGAIEYRLYNVRTRLDDIGIEVAERLPGDGNVALNGPGPMIIPIKLKLYIKNAVGEAIDEIIASVSRPSELSEKVNEVAKAAWDNLVGEIEDSLFLGEYEIEIKDDGTFSSGIINDQLPFSKSDLMQTISSVLYEMISDTSDAASGDKQYLIEWLDQNAENLRAIVPNEHEDAFDALYRLIHTPEVYEVSKPTVTASSWTVELREAWHPGVVILVHTKDGQTITLDRDNEIEGTAVASFSSPPVNVGAIESFEINFAPEKATRSVIKSVAETVDDIGDVGEEIFEFFTGQDDDMLTEEIEKARTFEIDRIRITAHTDPMAALPQSKSYELLDRTDLSRTLTAGDPAARWSGITPPEPDILETRTRRYDDYSEVEKLVKHIQANRMAYLRHLWLNEDPDKRMLRFQQYAYPIRRNGSTELVPLGDLIENRALGVVGNSVAFRLLNQGQLDEYEEVAEPDEYEEVVDDDPSDNKLVSMPTRGVYAETLLSKCNATEIRDVDRMPTARTRCRTEAPEITGVSPGSRRSDEELQPTVPASTVALQQPPAAPQPTGLSEALQVLATPNIFRDMSLGSETVQAANSLAQKALSEAGEAREQTLEALSSILQSASDGSGQEEQSAEEDIISVARDAVQQSGQAAQYEATQAHRRSDPVRNSDHQQNLDDAHEKGALSDEAYGEASERLHNADEQPTQGRPFPEVKQLSVEKGEKWVQGKILLANFEVGSADLLPEHKDFLRNQLMLHLADDGRITLLEGHTSKTGSTSENKELSEDRAESVRDFLVNELGFPAYRILTVKGVGESDPIDAKGPPEDPAERSVVVQYEAYVPVPIIRRPDIPVKAPEAKKYTKWEIQFGFLPHDHISEASEIKVKLRNRSQDTSRTLKGKIIYQGASFGYWFDLPSESEAWTEWIPFETEKPMAGIEWHMVQGDFQLATASLGEFISGTQAVIFEFDPMKKEIKMEIRLTEEDKIIGFQFGSSFMPFEAQILLTDPKPELQPKRPEKEETSWEWGFEF